MRALVGGLAALAALLAALPASAAAGEPKTGQSPGCTGFCLKVEPREAPEGTVFTFQGRRWRPNRRVTATFGVYCRPGEACIEIAYIARVRADARGRFSFRLRAGKRRRGDSANGIHAGGAPTFSQRSRGRTIVRKPRYEVIVPAVTTGRPRAS